MRRFVIAAIAVIAGASPAVAQRSAAIHSRLAGEELRPRCMGAFVPNPGCYPGTNGRATTVLHAGLRQAQTTITPTHWLEGAVIGAILIGVAGRGGRKRVLQHG